jgi:hypothetical protein
MEKEGYGSTSYSASVDKRAPRLMIRRLNIRLEYHQRLFTIGSRANDAPLQLFNNGVI